MHRVFLRLLVASTLLVAAGGLIGPPPVGASTSPDAAGKDATTDVLLRSVLRRAGFTGRVGLTLEQRLGRSLHPALTDVGRLMFFDNILSLQGDNSCAGCHSPATAFGDTQSIAIGVNNNGIVGSNRLGPRNQRKAPPVVNSAFYPRQMLNGRFESLSGDPFDNSQGFLFPLPEGQSRFPPHDAQIRTLLAAQGHIPPTELVEMAGFTGTAGSIGLRFDQFDDGLGTPLPAADENGFRNEAIRSVVLARFNANLEYRERLGEAFNQGQPIPEGQVTFAMIGQALAEFQLSLTRANAPLDRFARGDRTAMTPAQKRGALLFFAKVGCVNCHAVAGQSNEMFSDFRNHVLGVPQIAPVFGVGAGNVLFDGPGEDEDFGAAQISGDRRDRYAFRTSPLRNVALQPAFFHNGAFTRLEDAIRHHLNPARSALDYDPVAAGVDEDLTLRQGPTLPVLARLDRRLRQPVRVTQGEFDDLVTFVREALLDPQALPEAVCVTIPRTVPSGLPVLNFEGCPP